MATLAQRITSLLRAQQFVPPLRPALPPDVEAAHQGACREHRATYADPATGYTVFTSAAHAARGRCCGSACRHCCYGHARVAAPARQARLSSSAPTLLLPAGVPLQAGGRLPLRIVLLGIDRSAGEEEVDALVCALGSGGAAAGGGRRRARSSCSDGVAGEDSGSARGPPGVHTAPVLLAAFDPASYMALDVGLAVAGGARAGSPSGSSAERAAKRRQVTLCGPACHSAAQLQLRTPPSTLHVESGAALSVGTILDLAAAAAVPLVAFPLALPVDDSGGGPLPHAKSPPLVLAGMEAALKLALSAYGGSRGSPTPTGPAPGLPCSRERCGDDAAKHLLEVWGYTSP